MRRLLVASLATALAATPARAQPRREPARAAAMTEQVRQHWERGLAEHAAKRYAAASAAFETCYQLDPRREFLFAWAQAARLSGDCATAAAVYRRYLEVASSAKQRAAAQMQLAACEAAVPHAAPPPAAPAAAVTPPPAAASATPDLRIRAPWYADAWGNVLAGTGGVAVLAGTLMYVSSGRAAGSSAPTYGAYARRFTGAERLRAGSFVALGAGSILVAAGVMRMVLRDREPSAPVTRIGIGPGIADVQLGLHLQQTF